MHPQPAASSSDHPLTPDDVVRQLHRLPSAPQVLPRLKKLLGDGNSSLYDVVALIRLDQGIAARVLQMGNSAYFSHGTRCLTVDEAVNRVGFDQVYELVLNAVSSQILIRPLAVYAITADELWRMSVTCALAAELLAKRIGLDQEVAYAIGLFHGVGMVAIDEWAYLKKPDLRFIAGILPLEACELERKTLGFHNAEVGAALLRLWDFPNVMSEPLRWQYQPRGTSAHLPLASLLHVAKWLRSAVCTKTTDLPLPEPALLRSVNLTASGLKELIENVNNRLGDVDALLEIDKPDQETPPPQNSEHVIIPTPSEENLLKAIS